MQEYLSKANDMAKMAGAAYLNKDNGKRVYNAIGYPYHKFLENDGAQAHIAWDNKSYVICFRGTQEMSDIKADLNALPKRSQTKGWVHMGFYKEVEKLWDQLTTHVEKYGKEKQIYITGHSLGAAMATIAASRLDIDNINCLMTFGSPRVGTRSFVKNCKIPHYRFVNNNDVVTSVPFIFMGYKHHGTLMYISHFGMIKSMSLWQRLKDKIRGRLSAWKKRMAFDGYYDHDINYYIKYTREIWTSGME